MIHYTDFTTQDKILCESVIGLPSVTHLEGALRISSNLKNDERAK